MNVHLESFAPTCYCHKKYNIKSALPPVNNGVWLLITIIKCFPFYFFCFLSPPHFSLWIFMCFLHLIGCQLREHCSLFGLRVSGPSLEKKEKSTRTYRALPSKNGVYNNGSCYDGSRRKESRSICLYLFRSHRKDLDVFDVHWGFYILKAFHMCLILCPWPTPWDR